eukprot:gene48714-8669_t
MAAAKLSTHDPQAAGAGVPLPASPAARGDGVWAR